MNHSRATKGQAKTSGKVLDDRSRLTIGEVPDYLRVLDDAEFVGGWVAVLVDIVAQGDVGLKPFNDALVAVREEYKRRGAT